MEFLDPRKRRSQSIKLWIGYTLMTLVVLLGTVILVYDAYGYSIDTKTGEIIQDGLLFIDSKPGNANIYLNGTDQHAQTSSRLVVPAGKYTLTIKKDGYRDWQRTFNLQEHTVSRYVYPFLFPQKLSSKTVKTYPSLPTFVTQSPDQRWILVKSAAASSAADASSFDLYDTSQPTKASTTINLPTSIVTNPTLPGSVFKEVEWSTDNVHLLLQHTYQGGDEFIVLNRQTPSDSFNVNKQLSVNPTQVALRNKKISTLYLYNQPAGTLQVGDTNAKTVAKPILEHVLAYKSYGNDLIEYASSYGLPSGQAEARIWDSHKSYSLYKFNAGTSYILNVAQFQGHYYYVAGSNTAERVNIYMDPLDNLKNPAIARATPTLALRVLGATSANFSNNTRFISVEAGQKFAVYDAEAKTDYHYDLVVPLQGEMDWMDGHRLMGTSAGNAFIMDYDGINQQILSSDTPSSKEAAYFDKNFNQMYVMAPVSGISSAALQTIDMRAGSDLPKQ